MPALPPNSLIAVTGISGFIASHIGLCALKAGHRVRGTVRSWARAESLKAGYEKQGIPASELDQRLEFVIVDDLSSEDQWTAALKDVDGIVHSAFNIEKFLDKEIIAEAVAAMLSLLRAAKKYPSVKRVIFTSSVNTVVTPPMQRDKILTPDDWDDEVLNMVENGLPAEQDPVLKTASMFFMYSAAKMKAERAAWDFVKQTPFDLVSILPGTNMGPTLHGKPGSTVAWASGDSTSHPFIPNQWYVDVRDCAKLHFLALTTPSMGGKRFFANAERFAWNRVLGLFRKHFPNATCPVDSDREVVCTQKMDISVSTEIVGGWIGLEQSIIDLGKSLGY